MDYSKPKVFIDLAEYNDLLEIKTKADVAEVQEKTRLYKLENSLACFLQVLDKANKLDTAKDLVQSFIDNGVNIQVTTFEGGKLIVNLMM